VKKGFFSVLLSVNMVKIGKNLKAQTSKKSNSEGSQISTIGFRLTAEEKVKVQRILNYYGIDPQLPTSEKWKKLIEKLALTISDSPVSDSQNQPVSETKRSFLVPSPAELAYVKQKAIQRAKREGALERLKDREEFRKQALADREEYEYSIWKKRQEQREQRERETYRGIKVFYPGMG